jgi:hypothetical protein
MSDGCKPTPPSSGSGASPACGGTTPCPPTPTCHHPVNATSTLMSRNLDFGLRVKVTWQSPTGSLSDLGSCGVTEQITYSSISNPPFGPANGTTLPESGQTQRIPSGSGITASNGVAQDTHQHPRSLVRTPPSAGSYTVTQTYDYNCTTCGSGWVPFANYTITYTVYEKTPGQWWFKIRKTGPGGPFESDERI